MKKRLIIPISILLAITTILLVMAIFKLYTEAEKVQRSIFANEVLTAGDEIVSKIDAVLKGDTMYFSYQKADIDTTNSIPNNTYYKYAKKFLLDSTTLQPIGIVRSKISYSEHSIFISQYDTTYFDTTYRKVFPFSPTKWETDFDFTQFEDKNIGRKQSRYKMDINIVEIDSSLIRLLNRDFLNRIIKESLLDISSKHEYDFALYNAFTTNFVVLPSVVSPEEILKSEYIFSLKQDSKIVAPHYLILYFPTERGIYFEMMGTISLLIIFLLAIILIIAAFTLFYLNKQKKNTEVRNDFVNNMTHEFKTPIATISLACEAMSDEDVINDTAARLAYVSIVKDENERLKNMVNNILQLAQMKKGQLKLNIEKVDIHALVRSIAESVSLQVNSNSGRLVLKLNAKRPVIFADKTHIENAIINLVENAVKYTPKNPEIEITTRNDKKKKSIIIEIRDNGIGITKKNTKKIFQEFYRISKGNIHDTKGFGLGLDYVKKIVSLHGGSITVESELNKGSIFTLYLPIKKE